MWLPPSGGTGRAAGSVSSLSPASALLSRQSVIVAAADRRTTLLPWWGWEGGTALWAAAPTGGGDNRRTMMGCAVAFSAPPTTTSTDRRRRPQQEWSFLARMQLSSSSSSSSSPQPPTPPTAPVDRGDDGHNGDYSYYYDDGRSAPPRASSQQPPSPPQTLTTTPPNHRAAVLDRHLRATLGLTQGGQRKTTAATDDGPVADAAATEVLQAALRALHDPASGHDDRFGRPALRTCLAFCYPKPRNNDDRDAELDPVQLEAAAGRCARQVDFLIKRHRSHLTEWVRHHDPAPEAKDDDVAPGRTAMTKGEQQRLLFHPPFPIVLVLDNVRSAMNVGSLFRTAEAVGCAAVWTCGITPHPGGGGSDKVRKSALGAELLVPTRHFATAERAVKALRRFRPGVAVLGMETTDRSVRYSRFDYRPYYYDSPSRRQEDDDDDDGLINDGDVAIDTATATATTTSTSTNTTNINNSNGSSRKAAAGRGIALVLGNEVTGVDADLLPTLDAILELPTFGRKNSLNVAACAPVVLYEILRQWEEQQQQQQEEAEEEAQGGGGSRDGRREPNDPGLVGE